MARRSRADQIVSFDKVSFAYSEHSQILQEVSFDVFKHEHVSILGPSGSGKSTILHLIAGTHKPTSGQIILRDGVRESLALMVQGDGLIPWYSVEKNFHIAMRIHGIPKAEHEDRINRWLGKFGIEKLTNRFPLRLSGGQRQRVALARMLALDVTLLLLDEPLGSIDELQRERLQQRLGEVFSEEPLASVIVTHSVEEAALLSDTIFIVPNDQPIVELTTISNPLAPEERRRSNASFQAFCTHIREALR